MSWPWKSVFALLVVALVATAPASANPWLERRVMNIAHQGGEAEAPSNTMYAYKRALALGSDMLEVDVHGTADGQLVVMHDGRVDRTTEGSGYVYDMTLEQVQALDAAYDFVPGEGTKGGRPEADYVFRGVRTGAKPPPRGFGPLDFRVPTLEEVLLAYPDVPINIEIKGKADTDVASFMRNAELLAELLGRLGRSDGVIVASFNDLALAHFHQLAPSVGMAPATGAVGLFKLIGTAPPAGTVAFQVPITFTGLTVTDADFVRRAHAGGYGVHVWLSNDGENREIYEKLLGYGVDGIMAAEPAALERLLCQRGTPRPPALGPPRCSSPEVADCVLKPVRLSRLNARGLLRLRIRRASGVGRCEGSVRLRRAKRPRSALAKRRFAIAPGRRATSVRLRLRPGARRAVSDAGRLPVRVELRQAGKPRVIRRFALR
jgi:glycerophosphoryl diester phosphodiesterase